MSVTTIPTYTAPLLEFRFTPIALELVLDLDGKRSKASFGLGAIEHVTPYDAKPERVFISTKDGQGKRAGFFLDCPTAEVASELYEQLKPFEAG